MSDLQDTARLALQQLRMLAKSQALMSSVPASTAKADQAMHIVADRIRHLLTPIMLAAESVDDADAVSACEELLQLANDLHPVR